MRDDVSCCSRSGCSTFRLKDILGQEESYQHYTGCLWNYFLPSLLATDAYNFSKTYAENECYF